jgi:hypothetical protein
MACEATWIRGALGVSPMDYRLITTALAPQILFLNNILIFVHVVKYPSVTSSLKTIRENFEIDGKFFSCVIKHRAVKTYEE